MRNRSYPGNRFEVWNGQRTWFWCVADPHRKGSTIGAGSTKEEAVREACSLIEDMSARYCLRRECVSTRTRTVECQ
jgi:hypothetical protein